MMGNVPAATGARSAAEAAAASARWGLSPAALAIIVTTALALALRLWQLTMHGYLLGVTEYDDGVYFGSAVRLIHGAVPYRDFITVQPPGVMLLMTPVALLAGPLGTAKALAIGRVLTACAGAGGVTLTGLLIRRHGALAIAAACGLLAIYPDGVYAAHTVLIEPWLVLFCLAGALAVMDGDHLTASSRRLASGGAAFGFAGACKAWAVIPTPVVLGLLVLSPGLRQAPRRALAFLGGTVVGFALPVLPFAILAPHAFYNSVIVAQWSRTDDVRTSLWFRLASMIGFSHGPDLSHVLLLAVVCATAAVAVGTSLLATLASRQLPPPLEIFALVSGALVVVAFLWPADYYYHYAVFLGPSMALSVVLPISRLCRTGLPRPAPRTVYRVALAATAAAVLVLAVLQGRTQPDPNSHGVADAIVADEQVIPAGSCVVADTVSYTIAANRFISGVPGCPIMVDAIGTDYTLSHGRNGLNGAGNVPAVRQAWLSALSHAQYVWLSGLYTRRIPWTHAIASYFWANFRLVRTDASGGVYERVSGRR